MFKDETQTYIPRKTFRDLLNHERYDENYMDQLCEFMAGHALEAWLVKGENIYKEINVNCWPEDSDVACIQAPNSIRAKYGIVAILFWIILQCYIFHIRIGIIAII